MALKQLARGLWSVFGILENPFTSPNGMEENLRLIDDHLGLYTLVPPQAPGTALPAAPADGDGQIYSNGTYAVFNAGTWKTYQPRKGIRAVLASGTDSWLNTGATWSQYSVVDTGPAVALAIAAASRAEDFANSAAVLAPEYPTIAAGLAAVATNGRFTVLKGGADGLTRTTTYKEDAAGNAIVVVDPVSGSEFDPLKSTVSSVTNATEVDRYTNSTVSPGYLNRNTGAYAAGAAWVSIKVGYDKKREYRYTGSSTGTLAALVIAYGATNNRLAALDTSTLATGKLIDHSAVPAGTVTLGFSALAANAHSVIEKTSLIERSALGTVSTEIDANTANIATVLKTAAQIDYALQPGTQAGYLDQEGGFHGSPSWKLTARVEWSEAAVYLLSAFGHAQNVSSVHMFNDADQPIGVLFATGVQVVDQVISSALPGWNPACTGVRASGAINGSNLFAFKVTRKNIDESLLPSLRTMKADIEALEAAAPTAVRMLAPTEVYGIVGETKFLYARQIVQDPSLDLAWNVQYTNDLVAPITPASTADIPLFLQGMGRAGAAVELASFNMKVSPAVLVNPAAPRYIVCLGDSTTDGVANSDIQGAYPNELSRRLTGVGRAVGIAGDTLPAARSLSNMMIIGTRGSEVIKHEGRPGWNARNYLTQANGPGGLTNAFWNPGASQFDATYYFTQNGFAGVAADGSNLTFLIWLGWNDPDLTGAGSAVHLGSLIDRIHATHALADIILLGLNPPPRLNRKAFENTRYVSPAQIFQRAIVEFGTAYRALAASKPRCSFLQISQEYDPERAYRRISAATSKRNVVLTSMVEDYVHSDKGGISMVVDTVHDKLVHAYCRGP